MYRSFHPRTDVNRGKTAEKGWKEECIRIKKTRLDFYLKEQEQQVLAEIVNV